MQLRHHQEFYESWRAEAIGRIVGGPSYAVTASEGEPNRKSINKTGRAQKTYEGPATVPLLAAPTEWHLANDASDESWQHSQEDPETGDALDEVLDPEQMQQCHDGKTDSESTPKKPRALQNFPTFPAMTAPKRASLATPVRQPKSARTQ